MKSSILSKLKGQSLPIIGGRKPKKVMIAAPVYDKPEVETIIALYNMMLTTKHAHALVFRTSSLIHRARSFLAERSLNEGFDYLLFVDGDMVFPHWGLDRLIDRQVDVVGALCTMRQPPYLPTIGMIVRDETGDPLGVRTILSYPQDALMEVDSIGMAFTLISRKALLAVKALWLEAGSFRTEQLKNGGELPEDTAFCYRVKQAGLKVHCDTGLSILHKGTRLYGEEDFKVYQEELIKKNGVEGAPIDSRK